MNDPFGSFQNFMSSFQTFRANPAQYLMRYGIQGNNPDQIIQSLMQSGRLSQGQYNAARNAAARIQGMMR
jgi:hypothetical protein